MMTDLTILRPHHHHHHRPKLHAVRFAETAQLHIYNYKHHNVARNELWYTTEEYDNMKLAVREDVLNVRAPRASKETADDDAPADERSECFIGIEHLLTPACMHEVRACRARCTRAVLEEQARQGPSARFRWEAIALASFAQTRRPVMRARELSKLHQF
jgi:hypothetical protein